MQRTLAVFAKQPTPGRVKTRLAEATSAKWAALVHEAFLLDTLDRLSALEVRRVAAYTPADARPYFEQIAHGRWELLPQVEGDLGVRMRDFLQQSFNGGARATVLIGADSPTLPVGLVAQAFAELARADLVLGPAADGGYYLIGCTPPVPEVFDGIEWGSSRVLEQTVERLNRHPRRLALLPPWYDVDTLADWEFLRGHLAALRAAGVEAGAARTERLCADDVSTPRL